ncbi:hypothetical protein MPL3365_180293 [Mesorhizobium plurifarium]|nr:hypothetical protein MPL3365_180293 [Mesorhizobium plurifarium]
MCSKAGAVRGIAAVFFLRLNGIIPPGMGRLLQAWASVAAQGR